MTTEEFVELYEKHHDDEYIKFGRIQNKRSQRPDLHAFLLLDELVPGSMDIIGDSAHDEFYLDIDIYSLAKVISEAQIIELIRCGVRLDENENLCMFV